MTPYRDLLLRYDIDRGCLSPALAACVVRLELDAALREFVDRALGEPHGRALLLAHRMLRPLLSDFEINGLLGTHPMHLLSTDQWRRLLGQRAGGRLLDVGAGSGDVTAGLAPLFSEVVTTETARSMVRRLGRRGFGCWQLDLSSAPLPETGFDVIACLNVIDRCDAPRSLLERLTNALAPDGLLVVATPLPLSAFVYDGGTTREPSERLSCRALDWEAAVVELAESELASLGLRVLALTRAPYLSRGFRQRPLCVLDDAIFVCSRS